MRCRGLFLLMLAACGTAAWGQAVGPRWSAGFALQPQMLGPSAMAELSGRTPLLPGAAPQASQLVVGASWRTGTHSSLSLQAPIATRTPLGGAKPEGSEMQLAWSLRTRDEAQQWLGGGSPFKMALADGQTVITLKPRASRVSITLQHRW